MVILKCTCQFGVHALKYDAKTERYLNTLIRKNGEFKKIVRVETGKAYKVPVGYIIAHGIEANKLDTYGFDEWKDGELDTSSPK